MLFQERARRPIDRLPQRQQRWLRQLLSVRAYREGKPFQRDEPEIPQAVLDDLVEAGCLTRTDNDFAKLTVYKLNPWVIASAASFGWCSL